MSCYNVLLLPDNAPMYKIQNVAYPVTEYFLEDILKMTRYAIMIENLICCGLMPAKKFPGKKLVPQNHTHLTSSYLLL